MPFRRRLAPLSLALLGLSGLALAGCDTAPTTCATGQIEIQDFAVGQGVVATDSSRVRITYDGRLADGGREVAAGANQTVDLATTIPPGFRQGVAGMRAGGRRRFTLPPNLGFGPSGGPAGIPACARLTFNVELHQVLPRECGNAGDLLTDDIVIGEGAAAAASSTVTVNYVLRRSDGTEIQRVKAGRIALTTQVAGFRQGVAGDGAGITPMRVGGRRLLIVPPNLAYGLEGSPPSIPSCEVLTYEVELLGVE